uniref:Uncharacterized protein n=1 Tax=Panagrolaimus davidi TaxID=227884 RepID=A0A914Q1J6_9BILA
MKEEQTASRASFLEQENLQLRTQFELMKAELTKMQMQVMLLTNSSSTGTTTFSMPTIEKDSDVLSDSYTTPESTPKKPKLELQSS